MAETFPLVAALDRLAVDIYGPDSIRCTEPVVGVRRASSTGGIFWDDMPISYRELERARKSLAQYFLLLRDLEQRLYPDWKQLLCIQTVAGRPGAGD